MSPSKPDRRAPGVFKARSGPAARRRAIFVAELSIRSRARHRRDSARARLSGAVKRAAKRKTRLSNGSGQCVVAARQVARGAQPPDLARLLGALAHPSRIQMLLKLLGTRSTHTELARATGLKAGPLYHHVKELRLAGLLEPKSRDAYVLSRRGQRAILAALALARVCG